MRGGGIGQLLRSAAFARAKQWGCTKLNLECEATNGRGRALYKRFGMDEYGGDLREEEHRGEGQRRVCPCSCHLPDDRSD